MLHEKLLTANNLAIHVASGKGDRPQIVFLHGVTRRWQDFSLVIPHFDTLWQVIALDFRGHGRSARSEHYRTIDYVDDVVAALQQLVPGTAVLYGHSLGAMVAAAVAARVPQRVRALVLEDPPWHTLGVHISETVFHSHFMGMYRVARQGGTIDDLAHAMAQIEIKAPHATNGKRLGEIRDAVSLRFAASCLRQTDPAVLESIISGRWLDGYEWEAILSAIQCPTLLLQADWSAGGMLADQDADRAEKLISSCWRIRMAGVGHLIHWQAHERLLAHVTAFLSSLE